MIIPSQVTPKNIFEKIIIYLTFFFIFVYIGLIVYTLTTNTKWKPQMIAFFVICEVICYSFIMLSVLYYISSYFKVVTNTNIIKEQLFPIKTNQRVLSAIFDSINV